jgi:thiol-disulfide isomerase/thioredoxin
LADFRGRVVLLNLWATWCVPCRQEMPTLDRLQARLGGPDFQVIALSIDRTGAPAVRAFYEEIGVRHLPLFLDTTGNAVRQLNAPGLPTTLLLDRAGREIGRFVGPAEWDSPAIVETIEKALDRR